MVQAIVSATELPDHAKYGMFVLAILTHGTEHTLFGKCGRAVDRSCIIDILCGRKFPAMAGKPKVIILGGCFGGMAR